MLNGCQVFRAVASAKEEPERTGIREPKIVLEVIAELVQGTAVTSFLLQKTKEFEREYKPLRLTIVCRLNQKT